MELINGLMNNSQRAQSAEEIIPTLCDRIVHARLASDKRAAILTVKGFSREYRELVVANGLRGLISTLNDYTEDTDLLKATLETLLILFIRGEGDDDLTRGFISQQSRAQNGKYPSPLLLSDSNSIDQFSLWIADEVTKDKCNIQTLVNLLENTNFYVRLYTLQFLEALVSTRALKTKESILNTPLGIPKLVEVLTDLHDPVRNEAVLLLMAIANDNFNIQKLVAFENTFDRLFEIIHEEGDIRGSIVVQDCLTLISNLLKYNVSNQKLFLETNCLSKLAFLISEPLGEEPIIWNDQRLQNIMMALDIVKLFVIEGNESTPANQDALFKADIFLFILRLSFSANTPNSVRPNALLTVADLIANNKDIQLKFSSIDVPYIDPSLPTQLQNFKGTIPVVIALLNWCLFVNSVHVFDIRVAASHLLEAYFHGNDEARVGFIHDQIAEFRDRNGEVGDEQEEIIEPVLPNPQINGNGELTEGAIGPTMSPSPPLPKLLKAPPRANIFNALLEYDPEIKLNPYKIWFSSIILINAIHSNDAIKHIVTGLSSGDEESGEEVISAIQAISGLLLTTLNTQDQRISIGYLLLLIDWLYEDFEAVNDFLGDSSTVRSLLTYLSQASLKNSIIQGLVTILLGVAFEFSSKDSPIPRKELHALIVKMLGKDNYGFKILQLKENPAFADFHEDEIFNPRRDETGLPEVFFHPIVVQLIKENLYRIKNTLNQDPTLESNGRISYEKFEQLHSTYNDLRVNYEEFKERSGTTQQEVQTLLDNALIDLTEISDKHETVVKELEDLKATHGELDTKFRTTAKELEDLKDLHSSLDQSVLQQQKDLQSKTDQVAVKDKQISDLQKELAQVKTEKKKAEDGINKMSRELFQLTKSKEDLEKNVKTLQKDIQNNMNQQQKLEQSLKQKTEEVQSLKTKIDSTSKEVKAVNDEKVGILRHLDEMQRKDRHNTDLVEQMKEKLRTLTTTCNDLTQDKLQLELQIASLQKSHTKEVESLQFKVQELEASKRDLSQLSDSLNAQKENLIQSLESVKSEGQSSYNKLQESFGKLQAEYKSAKDDLETHKQVFVKYEGEIQELKGSLTSQRTEMKTLKESHANELLSLNSDHVSKLEGVQKETAIQKKLHDDELASLTIKLAELAKLKDSIAQELDNHKEKSSDINKNLSEKEKLVIEAGKKIMTLETEVNILRESEKVLKDAVSDSEVSHAAAISELKSTISELQQKVKDQEIELDDNAAEFEQKEAEDKKTIASLKEKLSSLEEEKKSLEASLEVISQSIEDKGKEYEDVTKVLKTKTAEVQELKTSLEMVKIASSETEKSLKNMKEEFIAITKERNQLKKKLDSATSEISKKDTFIQSLNDKIKEEKGKFLQAQKELEDQIRDMNASIDAKASAFEKERSLLSENSDASTKEYSEKVTKLEEEMANLEKKHGIKVGVLEKQKVKLEEKIEELTTLNAKLRDDAESLGKDAAYAEARATELEHELTKLKSDYVDVKKSAEKLVITEERLAETRQDVDTLKEEIAVKDVSVREAESKVRAQTAELEDIKKELESSKAEITSLSTKSESSSSELKSKIKALEKSIQKLESSKEELTKKLEATLESKRGSVEAAKKKLEDTIVELKISSSKVKDLQSKINEQESKISKLEEIGEEHSKKSTESSEKLMALEVENNKLKDSCNELSKEMKSGSQTLKDENAKLLTELERLKSELSSSAQYKEEADKLKYELETLKKITVAKSELDDMMLVLDDLDEKKNSYKQKVKDLGGEVSSDEEGDDEEDDDDDDDEDEDDE